MTSLAVVVVSYNTREHLRTCLASVLADSPAEVIVADNGSSDGSTEMVEREFPMVALDVDRSNPGYGGGANRGVRRSKSEYVLVLNSDTIVLPGALQGLAQYLDTHAGVGIVGPRLRNPDGSLQPSCYPFPSPLMPLRKLTRFGWIWRRVPFFRERSVLYWSHDRPRRVPWVVGAALAIRRSAFDAVHGFDDKRFFMYYEEVDLAYRLHLAGWETHFAPVADVVHVGSASTGQQQSAMLRERAMSSLRLYEEHLSRTGNAVASSLMRVGMFMRLGRDRIARRLTRDPARRAYLDDAIAAWQDVLRKLRSDANQP